MGRFNWIGVTWKRPWPDFGYYHAISVEGLRKNTKSLSQSSPYPGSLSGRTSEGLPVSQLARSWHSPGGTEENQDRLCRDSWCRPKIRTEYFTNTSTKRCRYFNLLSVDLNSVLFFVTFDCRSNNPQAYKDTYTQVLKIHSNSVITS